MLRTWYTLGVKLDGFLEEPDEITICCDDNLNQDFSGLQVHEDLHDPKLVTEFLEMCMDPLFELFTVHTRHE